MKLKVEWEHNEENFSSLLKYIDDDNVTDIDINADMESGEITVWITDIKKGEFKDENHGLTTKFIEQFTHMVANTVDKPFNLNDVSLEADTDELRVSILHESRTMSGRVVCIRKSPPFLRNTPETIITNGYCKPEILALLINCVRAKMNFVFTGEQGSGKTECLKFFSQYIQERVATIEDTAEIHYGIINPEKNFLELLIKPGILDYDEAIKKCLRFHAVWILLSEARGEEAKDLIKQWSTGCFGMTTLHTDDARNIPDRIMEMMGRDGYRSENRIYTFANVGVLIRVRRNENGELERYLDQICFFSREDEENKCYMIVEDGEIVSREIPAKIQKKFKNAKIENPFYEEGVEQIKKNLQEKMRAE